MSGVCWNGLKSRLKLSLNCTDIAIYKFKVNNSILMNNPIVLSFCIPTYNNINSLQRLVLDILTYNNSDIEIVVLDNGSTDDTLNVLQDIKDDRLHVYTNGENKGALFNMVNVLDKGKGEFLVYCTDHDYVDKQKIDVFKVFLQNNANLSSGYCEYNSKSNLLFEIYQTGYPALEKLAYITRHPTGYFFNNTYLKSVEIVKRFSDYEFVDLFPLEFVFAELCLKGDAAIYHDSLFMPERGTKVVKHKSATTNGNSQKAFFSPQTRLKLVVNFDVHICSLKITENEKERLRLNSFFRELNHATLGYKFIMNQEDICIHYFMERREIGLRELMYIGVNFYKGYSNKVIKVRYKSLLKQVNFKMKLFGKLGFALINKVVR